MIISQRKDVCELTSPALALRLRKFNSIHSDVGLTLGGQITKLLNSINKIK